MNVTIMQKTKKLQIWTAANQNTSITKSSERHVIYLQVHDAALRIDAHPMRECEWGEVMGSMEGCRKVIAGIRSQTSPSPSVPSSTPHCSRMPPHPLAKRQLLEPPPESRRLMGDIYIYLKSAVF